MGTLDHFTASLNACCPETRPTLAVAVSGGADSMALLLLADEWVKAHGGKLVALTVDHKLRVESAEEAAQVKNWCAAYGIDHHTLTWDAPKAKSADARDARYQLLSDWCKAHGISNLLTAHHQGDQAETLFFRLARGSTIRGLSCIPETSDLHGLRLIRPLLGVSKTALMDYLKSRNQPWIEDPSNQNTAYTRNSIRAQLQSLPNSADIIARAAAVASAFGRFRTLLDKKTHAALAECVTVRDENAVIDAGTFRKLPPETGLLMLAELIQNLTGDEHPPRTEKLERLQNWLLAPEGSHTALAHLHFRYQPEKYCFIVAKSA